MKEENERLYQFDVNYTLWTVFVLIVAWAAMPFVNAYGSEPKIGLVQVKEETNTIYVVGKNHARSHAFTIN